METGKLIDRFLRIVLVILMTGAMLGAAAFALHDLAKNQVSGQEVEELFVSALVEGVNFTATSTGIHRFTIMRGASEVCPPESQPDHPECWGWNTRILIYENRQIEWGDLAWAIINPNPTNQDFSVGDGSLRSTYEEAEQIGKGMVVDIPLLEDEYVTLVVGDTKGCFSDNSGGVYLSITVLPQHNLTVQSSAGGSVTSPGEGNFTYQEGTGVDLVVKAEQGYRFVSWTGDVDDIADVNDLTTTITMNDDYSITANFEEIPEYTLTISAAGGSVTTPGEGDFTHEEGTVVGLEAEPDEGYQFVDWTGDVDTIADVNAATTTITMNDDYSITANFEETPASPFGCFVATAAYGTPMAQEIQILREFRDEYLLTNALGKALVDVYYRISPPIANFITDHPRLKPIVRAGLMPVVTMCSIVLDIVPRFGGNET
jgi:hypothetical protein